MAGLSAVGVPEVAPEAGVAPVNRTSASAASFGGATAQALEGVGQAAMKTADFFGDVAVDDQANQLFEKWNKKLRGDPNQMVPGPDGQMQPDTGYMGLKGRNALDQRPGFEKGLDDDLKAARANIFSPKMQQKFDDQTRRYRQHVIELAGAHSDTQANHWYDQVNKASGAIALTHIANNAENPEQVAAGAADLINARVKDAQIKGGGPELIQQAVESAKRDALTAQLNAISVKDPEKALRMLDKNRTIAGLQYDELSRSFRARADTQMGDRAAEGALLGTYKTLPAPNAAMPVLDQAGQAYGISPSYLQRTRQIESNGDDNAVSPTGARGPFQFTGTTAKQYGLTNPHDLQSSAYAAARLAADNKAALTARLGRPPTDTELYLAHQQGAGGAAKLLANPNVRAGDLVGDKAIRVNGGNPNAPAGEFTSMWATRFGGGSGAGLAANLASRKAEAYTKIIENPELTDAARQHALTRVSQTITALAVAEGQQDKAKKEINDTAADGYVQRMGKGDYAGMVDQISSDPKITDWHTRSTLLGMAQKSAEESSTEATKHYGAGFFQAMKAINAPPGDPSRLTDPSQIYERAGPGGDLTLSGATRLAGIMKENVKSVDNSSVHRAKTGILEYVRSSMAKEQIVPGFGPMSVNKRGMEKFNSEFIPQYEAAYDQWLKEGKNPWDFMTKKNAEEIMNRIYPPSERAKDTLAGSLSAGDDDKTIPLAPAGANPSAWTKLVGTDLKTSDGKPYPKQLLATALETLMKNPTPENIKRFNESKYGTKAGFSAEKIIQQLKGEKPVEEGGDAPEGFVRRGESLIPKPGGFRS